jgi:hypothetical protein
MLAITFFRHHRINCRLLTTAAALSMILLSPVRTFAQNPDAAEALIARYIAASGGEEAFSKLKNRVIRGKFAMPDYGLEAEMVSYSVPPDRSYLSIDTGDEGFAASGVLGDTVWDVNPRTGPRILQGAEKASRLRDSTWDPLLEWKKHFQKAEVGRDENIMGKSCSQLILTPHEGLPTIMFFDKKSGLPREIRSAVRGVSSRSYPSDYREVDGIKMPFKLAISTHQYTVELLLETVEHNVDIPENQFDPPPEIQALLEK